MIERGSEVAMRRVRVRAARTASGGRVVARKALGPLRFMDTLSR